MPRFRFKLQPVLDQRQAVEKERQREVAVLERDRVGLEQTIAASQQSIASCQADVRAMLTGPVPLREVRRDASAAVRADARARRAALQLAGVHQRLAAARTALLQAARARKAVELLKERRYEQWREDERRREAAQIDEIAVMRGHDARQGERGSEA